MGKGPGKVSAVAPDVKTRLEKLGSSIQLFVDSRDIYWHLLSARPNPGD